MTDQSWLPREMRGAERVQRIDDEKRQRAAIEYWVETAIDWLNSVDAQDGVEGDGDELEDDEGQYWVPGGLLPPGSLDDDEPD
jgi:hypothetical protein